MAITRVGYNTGIATSNTVLTPDVSIAVGDWMVVVFAAGTTSTFSPLPAGWLPIVQPSVVTGTLNTTIFSKRREEGETSYTFTHGGAVQYALFWLRGVADSGWIVGAPHARADGSGNNISNIAYEITTTVPGTEVLTISTERTSVQETGVASVVGATEWFFSPQPVSTYLETIWVGYSDMPAPGQTERVTVTYPNTQTANGFSIQIGLPPSAGDPGALAAVLSRFDGNTVTEVEATLWNGTVEVPVSPDGIKYGDYRIADLLATTPFYIAHRGGGKNWPEHTMRSYVGAANWGMKAIEISTVPTSDGVIVCNHDATTTRTTGVTHTVGAVPFTTLQGLTHTAAQTDNPAQDRQPFSKVEDVLARFAHSHVLFVEPKIGGAWQADLRNMLVAATDDPDRIVWKASINASSFTASQAVGFTTWGYYIYGDPLYDDVEGLAARTDIDMLGVEANAPTEWIERVVAAGNALGKPVIAWPIVTPADRDRVTSLGCVGLMTSDLRALLPKFP